MSTLSLRDIRRVAADNRPHILTTPVHSWVGREIADRVGVQTEIVLKLELFQHTGTFKARGGVTSVSAIAEQAQVHGITAVSAGNHAVAAAYAAQVFGVSAKVVMIKTADPVRVAAAQAYGAEVLMAPTGAEAFAMAERIQAEEGRLFVHPFEGRSVALGTATLGLEFHEQAKDLDAVIIAVGGGGLCGGVSEAFRQLSPRIQIFGVEPSGADTMHRSFAAGVPQPRSDVATIADSLAPPYALPYSFGLCRDNVDRLVMVEDDEILDAMRLLFQSMKLAVEPAAAAAAAALLGPLRDELHGKRVGVIVCGANISPARFAELITSG